MQELVVVGNGMAGARVVEEILARGGGERFRITVFGDEPYGNYNRIMLSHVLAGDGADEIYLNPLDWYAENDVTLHAGVRVVRVDRFADKVFGNDGTVLGYDKLIIATGSRPFIPPIEHLHHPRRTISAPKAATASASSLLTKRAAKVAGSNRRCEGTRQ